MNWGKTQRKSFGPKTWRLKEKYQWGNQSIKKENWGQEKRVQWTVWEIWQGKIQVIINQGHGRTQKRVLWATEKRLTRKKTKRKTRKRLC